MAIKKAKQRVRNAKVAPKLDAMLDGSTAVIITKYGGMTMPQLDKVRKQMREAKAEFHITKNTLVSRALKAKGYDVPAEWLIGSTAMSFVYGEAPVVAKALGDLSKEFDKLSVVGGVLTGKAISAAQVKALADMPSIDVLRAQLIVTIASPASNIVGVLNSAVGSIMYALQARIDKETPAVA